MEAFISAEGLERFVTPILGGRVSCVGNAAYAAPVVLQKSSPESACTGTVAYMAPEVLQKGSPESAYTGTVAYMAPEVLQKGSAESAYTGTVAYMAPEVLQKGAMAMPADVYSFAMLMLELWTGEIVYSGINSHQVGARWKPFSPS